MIYFQNERGSTSVLLIGKLRIGKQKLTTICFPQNYKISSYLPCQQKIRNLTFRLISYLTIQLAALIKGIIKIKCALDVHKQG